LQALGIRVRADLPVGQTLQEHPLITVPIPVLSSAFESGHQPTVCVRYSSGLAGGGRNDMMILTGGGYRVQGLNQHSYSGIRLWVMESFSTGQLRLVSRDPIEHPAIDLGLLNDSRDVDRMADGLSRITDLLNRPSFRRLLTGLAEIPRRDDLQALVGDGYSGHVSSTCPIGRPGDDRAVLDAECRVIGMEHLRVIDASSMPFVPRANINLSVLTLAEHAVARMAKSAAR
jgi:choline dehydrogenase-like flavoprotein